MNAKRFYVGITDNDWFDFLSMLMPDEVNFWRPGGGEFKSLEPGELFLFKLHSPLNFIAGGGFFVKYSIVPTSLAWETFGEKNGTENFVELLSKINMFRRRHGNPFKPDPPIGCIVLANPFFFKKEDWVPAKKYLHPNIVRGIAYDTSSYLGAQLWEDVQIRLKSYPIPDIPTAAEEDAIYGSEYLVRGRLGQGAFRIIVTDAYNRTCAITGERTLPVLEAAHIKPITESGPNFVNNGLLLRSDLHKLFDLGYLTITKDFNVEVSKRIKEEFKNGREYYKFHGDKLQAVPANLIERPSKDYIEWHNQNIYIP